MLQFCADITADDGWICKPNNHNDTCNEQIPGITKIIHHKNMYIDM